MSGKVVTEMRTDPLVEVRRRMIEELERFLEQTVDRPVVRRLIPTAKSAGRVARQGAWYDGLRRSSHGENQPC